MRRCGVGKHKPRDDGMQKARGTVFRRRSARRGCRDRRVQPAGGMDHGICRGTGESRERSCGTAINLNRLTGADFANKRICVSHIAGQHVKLIGKSRIAKRKAACRMSLFMPQAAAFNIADARSEICHPTVSAKYRNGKTVAVTSHTSNR